MNEQAAAPAVGHSTTLRALFQVHIPLREACLGAALFLARGSADKLLPVRVRAGALAASQVLETLPSRWGRELAYEVLREEVSWVGDR